MSPAPRGELNSSGPDALAFMDEAMEYLMTAVSWASHRPGLRVLGEKDVAVQRLPVTATVA